MNPSITRHDPEGLYRSPLFSQVVVRSSGGMRSIHVAGQAPIDADGRVVGEGDLAAQAEQVFANVRIAVESAGGSLADVVEWTFYLVAGQPIAPVAEAYRRIWPAGAPPPMITTLYVAALANPAYLFEAVTLAARIEP